MTSTFKESSGMVSLKVSASHNAFPTIIFQIKKNTNLFNGNPKVITNCFRTTPSAKRNDKHFSKKRNNKKMQRSRDE